MRRDLIIGVILCVLLGAAAVGPAVRGKPSVVQAASVMAPRFEVDPMWPKPLPNHWVMGATVGVSVDAHSHIWIIHRPNALEDNEVHAAKTPPWAKCCTPAPPVLEFRSEERRVGKESR